MGGQIHDKNPNYCELTAQYWVWKNCNDKYDNIGLCHYRRYFSRSTLARLTLIDNKRIDAYLSKYDIILPSKWYWKYTVKEVFDQGNGKKKDLDTTRNVIKALYPEYLQSYDRILNSKSASYCNMFIASRRIFNDYSEWLFNILNEVEKQTDLTNYTKEESRIYGYLSEILLNVYVEYNNFNIKYVPMIEKDLSIFRVFKKNIVNLVRRAKCI